MKDPGSGKTWHRVLRAVALLGEDLPEVTDLNSIAQMYDEKGNVFKTIIFDEDLEVVQLKEHIIQKRGNKWVLISKTTGQVLGTHDSREGALRQEAAIKARQNMNREEEEMAKTVEEIEKENKALHACLANSSTHSLRFAPSLVNNDLIDI